MTCLGAVWRYGYIILYPCRSYELSFMIERVKKTCLIMINCLATEMGTILENSLKLQFVSDDDGRCMVLEIELTGSNTIE